MIEQSTYKQYNWSWCFKIFEKHSKMFISGSTEKQKLGNAIVLDKSDKSVLLAMEKYR